MDSEIGGKFQSEQVIEELRKYKTKGARATAYLRSVTYRRDEEKNLPLECMKTDDVFRLLSYWLSTRARRNNGWVMLNKHNVDKTRMYHIFVQSKQKNVLIQAIIKSPSQESHKEYVWRPYVTVKQLALPEVAMSVQEDIGDDTEDTVGKTDVKQEVKQEHLSVYIAKSQPVTTTMVHESTYDEDLDKFLDGLVSNDEQPSSLKVESAKTK